MGSNAIACSARAGGDWAGVTLRHPACAITIEGATARTTEAKTSVQVVRCEIANTALIEFMAPLVVFSDSVETPYRPRFPLQPPKLPTSSSVEHGPAKSSRIDRMPRPSPSCHQPSEGACPAVPASRATVVSKSRLMHPSFTTPQKRACGRGATGGACERC